MRANYLQVSPSAPSRTITGIPPLTKVTDPNAAAPSEQVAYIFELSAPQGGPGTLVLSEALAGKVLFELMSGLPIDVVMDAIAEARQ